MDFLAGVWILVKDGWRSWTKRTFGYITDHGTNAWRSWIKKHTQYFGVITEEWVEILDEKNIWMLLMTMRLMHGEPG